MVTLGNARTLLVVIVLTVVALGLLAVRSARHSHELRTGSHAVTAVEGATPGAAAHERHTYRATLEP
jgi:hypothetical protein